MGWLQAQIQADTAQQQEGASAAAGARLAERLVELRHARKLAKAQAKARFKRMNYALWAILNRLGMFETAAGGEDEEEEPEEGEDEEEDPPLEDEEGDDDL